ncbi:MAG: hypothetical protein FWC47_11860 [Oscillospiraceae bacterium]|nr:hypothetical protein [Oscillospiraceae bacterium]
MKKRTSIITIALVAIFAIGYFSFHTIPALANLVNMLFTNPLNLEWIDDHRVALTAHVNPALNVYIVTNKDDLSNVTKQGGIDFKWDSNMNNLYSIVLSPYFANGKVNDKIMKNDNDVVYEATDSESIIPGMTISGYNDENIYFFTKDTKQDQINLNIGNQSNGKIKNLKKVKWNNGTGKIKVISNDSISIENIDQKITFDLVTLQVTNIINKTRNNKNNQNNNNWNISSIYSTLHS